MADTDGSTIRSLSGHRRLQTSQKFGLEDETGHIVPRQVQTWQELRDG